MFFAHKISKIRDGDRVLEVGPGANPHPRSDVLLEKNFTEIELQNQNGNSGILKTDKKIIYYDGDRFPFERYEFDYVICSHVVEHVGEDDLPLFLEELMRVAPRGYIEFPTIYYEWIYNFDVHLTYLNYKNGILYYSRKDKSIYIEEVNRFFLDSLRGGIDSHIVALKDYFFQGFEWENNFVFQKTNKMQDLCVRFEKVLMKTNENFYNKLKKKLRKIL